MANRLLTQPVRHGGLPYRRLPTSGSIECYATDGGESPFFFGDSDRLVVIGDSITVQGDYGRYVENFIRTRYPRWHFVLRNAGINGHTARMGLPHIDADVLVWKPTVALVNWGMNNTVGFWDARASKTSVPNVVRWAGFVLSSLFS